MKTIIQWQCWKCKKIFTFDKKTLEGTFPAKTDAFSNKFDECEKCFKGDTK